MLNIIAGTLSVGVTPSTNSYESIATVTVGSGGSSSIDFTSIPATYKHLQIRGIARTSQTGTPNGSYLTCRFNGISTSNSYYGGHYIVGNGSTASAGADGTADLMYVERISTADQTSSVFGTFVMDILDYAVSGKNRVMRSLAGYDNNGSGQILFQSGMLLSTPAITSITLYPAAGNFVQYSTFALYGIKGS